MIRIIRKRCPGTWLRAMRFAGEFATSFWSSAPRSTRYEQAQHLWLWTRGIRYVQPRRGAGPGILGTGLDGVFAINSVRLGSAYRVAGAEGKGTQVVALHIELAKDSLQGCARRKALSH